MKLHMILIGALLMFGCAGTQNTMTPDQKFSAANETDGSRSKADEVKVSESNLGAMKILVKHVPGAELVATHIYVTGGVRNWEAETAGVEVIAGRTSVSGGTRSLDKSALAKRLSTLGAQLRMMSGEEYSAWRAEGMADSWLEAFDILADCFLDPALPETELELQKQRQLQNVKRQMDTPDEKLRKLHEDQLYKDHPFAKDPSGTVESIEAITLDAAKAHLAKLRVRSRMILVVIGDVDPARVLEKATERFSGLEDGDFHYSPMSAWNAAKVNVETHEAELPTNYVTGTTLGPKWTDPDFHAARIALSALGQRLFEEIRTKRNLAYAAQAWMSYRSSVPSLSVYVSSTDPNAALEVMRDEIHRIRTEGMSQEDLRGIIASYMTRGLMREEGFDGQASSLVRALLFTGDWRNAEKESAQLRGVTAEQVKAVSDKYLHDFQVTVLGDPAEVDEAVFGSF